jgi:hypothetical protein
VFSLKQNAQNTGCPGYGYTKIHAYILVPKSFMKFMFSTVYRVTQKDFYAHPYTSMWESDHFYARPYTSVWESDHFYAHPYTSLCAPVVARQISKQYSSL